MVSSSDKFFFHKLDSFIDFLVHFKVFLTFFDKKRVQYSKKICVKSLDVVKYVDSKKGLDSRALVEQCGEFLDKKDAEKAELLKSVAENSKKSADVIAKKNKDESEKLKLL